MAHSLAVRAGLCLIATERHAVSDEPDYWFPAKSYGWGWGVPATWQGWLVIAGYVVLIGAGAVVISPSQRPGLFSVYLIFLTLILVAICWAKGEPPRWRWGERNGPP